VNDEPIGPYLYRILNLGSMVKAYIGWEYDVNITYRL